MLVDKLEFPEEPFDHVPAAGGGIRDLGAELARLVQDLRPPLVEDGGDGGDETPILFDELSKLTAQDERLVATITTILDERRAEILDEAGKLRTQIAYPAASGWDVIEGLLLELAFINQHHP